MAEGFVEALKVMKSSTEHQALLYRSALISLISSAEWFLSQVIRQHLVLHVDAAGGKDKVLSLEDLKALGSIQDATNYVIDSRIDELMWGGFESWFSHLTERIKLSLGYVKAQKKHIVEVFQRRNVMVHNNGIVHSSYLGKVEPELRVGISIGSALPISSEYLSKAIDLIETNFILIAAELWKQLDANDRNRGGILTDVAFERLRQGHWRVAEGLSFFLMTDKRLPERDQIIGTLNYWQSLKWQDRFGEVRDQVQKADFSAKDDLYQLARHALLDDAETFFEVLPDVFRAEKLDIDKLSTWPIFREMRKSTAYQAFISKHGPEHEAVASASTENAPLQG